MEKPGAARFIVDRTVGKLGRWLRILGFDVEYLPTCEVCEISRYARKTGRIAITRIRSLSERLGENSILLETGTLDNQIRHILRIYGIEACNPFSRCSVCNIQLLFVDKDAVRGRVPEYVYNNHDEFAVCTSCGRYYWRGTHWREMHEKISKLMEL
ncbi:MAG: Mut7-C RNAse domain-containing protein [bacterium]